MFNVLINGQISVGPDIVPAFGTIGRTEAVILFDVAVVPCAQIVLAVRKQLITSLLSKVVVVNVEAVAPLIFVPFFFH